MVHIFNFLQFVLRCVEQRYDVQQNDISNDFTQILSTKRGSKRNTTPLRGEVSTESPLIRCLRPT